MENKRVDIKTGFICNNNCRFCLQANNKLEGNRRFEDIKKDLGDLGKGCDIVVISGGEPTIHENFFDILQSCAKKSKEVILVTNGRAFYYSSFCKKLKECESVEPLIKICGHTAHIHDSLTAINGCFKQTLQGIKNLKGLGIKFSLLIIVTEQNFIFLSNIINFLSDLNPSKIILAPPVPAEKDMQNYEKVILRYSEILVQIKKTDTKKQNRIHLFFPLCFLNDNNSKFYNLGWSFKKSNNCVCNLCIKKDECIGIPEGYEKLYGLRELKPFQDQPVEIAIEVTSDCNLDCPICFNKNYYVNKEQKYPLLEDIKKIIDKIPVDFISHIRFTGGEPLLRNDIFEILEYAKSNGFEIWFNTNGTLITKENAQKLSNYVTNVLLPLNSYDEDSEEKASGYRCFATKLKGIKLLKEAGIKTVRAGTIATQDNIKNLEKIFSYVQKLELDDWELYRPIPHKKDQDLISGEDIKELVDKLISFKKIFNQKHVIANAIPFCACDPEKIEQVAIGAKADDGHMRFVIGIDFKARPSYFIKETIGDIRMDSVQEIWDSDFMKNIRGLKLVPEECRGCKYLKKCKGGSRFIANLVSGSYDSKDQFMNLDNIKKDIKL